MKRLILCSFWQNLCWLECVITQFKPTSGFLFYSFSILLVQPSLFTTKSVDKIVWRYSRKRKICLNLSAKLVYELNLLLKVTTDDVLFFEYCSGTNCRIMQWEGSSIFKTKRHKYQSKIYHSSVLFMSGELSNKLQICYFKMISTKYFFTFRFLNVSGSTLIEKDKNI
jgi:hypothetical protein